MRRLLVAGALAAKPGNGGEAWVRLSWVLGLQRLGFDVWLIEQLAPGACRDASGEPVAPERSVGAAWFERVVERFDLADRASLLSADGRTVAGVAADAVADAAAGAELLVNVSGNLSLEPLLSLPRTRAYLDVDPGYTQLWHRAGLLGGSLARHEHLLSVGLGIDRPGCGIPTEGLRWRAIAPPVVLEAWAPAADAASAAPPGRCRFTTVASWRGGYGRVQDGARLYGQKAHEFRRFAPVAAGRAGAFEVALEIDPADERDLCLLRRNGWAVVDPREVAGDPLSFRSYVQGSAAEFSPAQGIYVETRSGWFGDRTTRYLACGRPAVVQDTGLPPEIPTGEGLLTFRTPADAAAAADAVAADYERHARGARALAEACFDSDRVLGAVLEDVLP